MDMVVVIWQVPNVEDAWNIFWKGVKELEVSIRTSQEGAAVRLFMIKMLEVRPGEDDFVGSQAHV